MTRGCVTSKTDAADLVAIADAHLVVAESFHREVLAELSVHEVVSSELAFPVTIRVDLVDEHRPLVAAVAGQVVLTVAVNVELADPAGTGHGFLEDSGKDCSALPGHVLGQADVDRQQPPNGLGGGIAGLKALGLRVAGDRRRGGPASHRGPIEKWVAAAIKLEFDPTEPTCLGHFRPVASVGVRSRRWPRPR